MRKRNLILAAFLALAPFNVYAKTDVVMGVVDGDTFRIAEKYRKLQVSVRILGIDTPEHDSKALCEEERVKGIEALAFAAQLLGKSENKVTLYVKGWDKYGGRILAQVYLKIDGKLVSYSEEMIRKGYARIYNGEAKGTYWCDLLAPKVVR